MASYFNAKSIVTIPDSPPVFDLDTPPLAGTPVTVSNKVCGENAVNCNLSTPTADMLETSAVAVLVSFGDNGEYTWNNLGTASAFGAREYENADQDNYFWKETGTYSASDGFDDQVVWLTGFDVKSAMLRSDSGLRE